MRFSARLSLAIGIAQIAATGGALAATLQALGWPLSYQNAGYCIALGAIIGLPAGAILFYALGDLKSPVAVATMIITCSAMIALTSFGITWSVLGRIVAA